MLVKEIFQPLLNRYLIDCVIHFEAGFYERELAIKRLQRLPLAFQGGTNQKAKRFLLVLPSYDQERSGLTELADTA
jgi:hypothetical protein